MCDQLKAAVVPGVWLGLVAASGNPPYVVHVASGETRNVGPRFGRDAEQVDRVFTIRLQFRGIGDKFDEGPFDNLRAGKRSQDDVKFHSTLVMHEEMLGFHAIGHGWIWVWPPSA